MSSKTLRRLAKDHAALQKEGLPPNYFWPPHTDGSHDLMSLDLFLAGPEGTPYSEGVFKLRLEIPTGYPQQAPTAAFKTKIWHPNVDEDTGAVCVDTLKKDWNEKLGLRHVLVVINCLLVSPNPASALNGEAGKVMDNNWGAFERRAKLMASVHAAISPDL
ncbi:UBC-like protein, partial [Aulographum hederae CBS 113979]